jgi:hypothetical protein
VCAERVKGGKLYMEKKGEDKDKKCPVVSKKKITKARIKR